MQPTLFEKPRCRALITPRDYQIEDHDESFRLWDSGVRGVLTRAATGLGKTLMSALKASTWNDRSDDHRVMVLSYEQQLVYQFAQEIRDYLGVDPGIEMDSESICASAIPKITVASRQSLLRAKPPTDEQLEELRIFGVQSVGSVPSRRVKTYLSQLRKGCDIQAVLDDIEEMNSMPEARDGHWSRLHKFNWKFNWLIVMDEAHKWAYHLVSCRHIVDWFNQNPSSRFSGITATPKRGDGVSIGHTLFPGIAIDYPLFALNKRCAVREGYAVPYVQRYISVEGVDFANLKRVTEGGDFDEAELERVLGSESQLAKLVDPLLDMVGTRRTIIFSPGVEMAKNVARYINARCQAKCPTCELLRWYPTLLVGNGAACRCGASIEQEHVTKSGEQAKELDAGTRPEDRKLIYEAFERDEFTFMSVVGLCREGFNSPNTSCIAIFRPVSKKASSLAEQMKGRGCRPHKSIAGILHTLPTAADRVRAIKDSPKPDALIVDLVGVTGLADCASTVEIYAEGLPDEVRCRAQRIIEEADEEVDVEEAIEQATREDAEERERIKQEREAAEQRAREEYEKRAKADARAIYTVHEMGHGAAVDPGGATEKMMSYMRFLGFELQGMAISKRKAGRIIDMLKRRVDLHEVARLNGIGEAYWKPVAASVNQVKWLRWKGVDPRLAKTPHDASLLIGARKDPATVERSLVDHAESSRTVEELNGVGRDLALVRQLLPRAMFERVLQAGIKRKATLEMNEQREPGSDDF